MSSHEAWLSTLDELGGFFTLAPAPDPALGAVPWPEVLAEPALGARFATVRAALADGAGLAAQELDPKVAVSAVQVSLASRLWSVALAGAVLHGWVPRLTGDNLLASPEHRGRVPLGLRDPRAGYAVTDPADAPPLLDELVVRAGLADLETACAGLGRTPRRVLASNSTSALIGGTRVLARLRQDRAGQAWALTRTLLTLPTVAEGGGVADPGTLPDGVGGPMQCPDEAFLRSGCCVFYRLPEHGLCPDCVLAPSRPEQVTPGH